MRSMTAKNGNQWTIHGLNFIPSDVIHDILQTAINSGNPQQQDLQQKTGHRAPIIIDKKNYVIDFQPW